MSFETTKVAALRQVAEGYGLDEAEAKTKTKKEILAWLEEEGISSEYHEAAEAAQKAANEDNDDEEDKATPSDNNDNDGSAAPAPTKPTKGEDLLLLKMTRSNYSYEALGKYQFSKDHPFAAVPRNDANEIFRLEDGFVLATDAEVKEFYDR